MVLPSSVEFVADMCFCDCDSLIDFTIRSPSHLRELLDLSPHLSGEVRIPDSVEALSFALQWGERIERVVTFGLDSKLRALRVESDRPARGSSFLCVPSRILKILRRKMEFEPRG
jgi:hypothetical protein